jgi:hypothetical protein
MNQNQTQSKPTDAEQESGKGLDETPCSADSDKLTPEQIKNWRNVLLGTVGPYALLMPDEDVQKMRVNMQAHFSEPNSVVSTHE